jgi:hypothetical protein
MIFKNTRVNKTSFSYIVSYVILCFPNDVKDFIFVLSIFSLFLSFSKKPDSYNKRDGLKIAIKLLLDEMLNRVEENSE